MTKKFLLISFLILVLITIAIFLFLNSSFTFPEEIKAGTEDNVYGFAWAQAPQASGEKLGMGWISFNCNSPELPSPRCSQTNYGVNIEPDGSFSGYAYFDMDDPNTPEQEVGWISFNRSDTGNPPGPPFNTGSGPIARVDLDGTVCGQVGWVCGWARALNYGDGWDGWIKLRKHPTDSGADYGVYIDPSTGQFHGFAWGDQVMGWISFNCANRGVCTSSTGEGGPSDYKVYTTFTFNNPPTVTDMTVDAAGPDNYCNIGPGLGVANFSWTYNDPNGDPETRFDFQVDNDPSFSSPEVDRSFTDLNNPSGTTNSQSVEIRNTSTSPGGDYLTYNTTYYWRIRVYDNQGQDSGWVEGSSFNTDTHPWPWPDFTWTPEKPAIDQVVEFTDQSTAYGGTSIADWFWTFQDGEPATANTATATTTFVSKGIKDVTLQVTDSDGYICDRTKQVTVTLPLPGWREIPPK
jgi:hypothetical protein